MVTNNEQPQTPEPPPLRNKTSNTQNQKIMPPPSLRDLRKQCRAAGLEDGGNKQDLVDRLQEHETENFCDAFLVTKAMIAATEAEIKRNAKKAFEDTLQETELEVQRERGELYVGNLRGLGLAGLSERMRLVEEEQARTKSELKEKYEEVDALKAEVAGLNLSVSTLKLATQDYKRVRARFVSVFKRDILAMKTAWDTFIIDSGNIIVHEGDVLIDALLYDYNGVGSRTDFFVFTELYDINPQDVLKISK